MKSGTKLCIALILLSLLFVGGTYAALLSYFGQIKMTTDVKQAILVDGKSYPDTIIEETATVAGGESFCRHHWLTSQTSVPVTLQFDTTYSPDGVGITTTYWKVSDTSGISIDGMLTDGEWDGATSFGLVPDTYTVYVTADCEFMYVAFDYAIAIGSDFASFNTYKEGVVEPETINAPCVTSWGPVWDTIVDEDGDGVPETWHREDPTTRFEWKVDTATELKVPLAQLHLAPGDTIKMIFVLNHHETGPHLYPEGAASFDLSTYMDFTIGTEIPEATPFTLEAGERLDFCICYSFDLLIEKGTYEITTTVSLAP